MPAARAPLAPNAKGLSERAREVRLIGRRSLRPWIRRCQHFLGSVGNLLEVIDIDEIRDYLAFVVDQECILGLWVNFVETNAQVLGAPCEIDHRDVDALILRELFEPGLRLRAV